MTIHIPADRTSGGATAFGEATSGLLDPTSLKVGKIATRVAEHLKAGSVLTRGDTSRTIVHPILAALGWDMQDLTQVRSEFPATKPMDLALHVDGKVRLLVDTVALKGDLASRYDWAMKAAHVADAPWCVLTDGREWRIYNASQEGVSGREIYLSTLLDGAGREGATSILSLLACERVRNGSLEQGWRQVITDQKVREALGYFALQNENMVTRICRQYQNLTTEDVRNALSRARIIIDPIFDSGHETPQVESPAPAAVADPELVAQAAVPDLAPVADVAEAVLRSGRGKDKARRKDRTRLMTVKDLLRLGKLTIGDRLTVAGHPKQSATLLDSKLVLMGGEKLTHADWVFKVKGVKANNIYRWVTVADGRTLGELRDEVMGEQRCKPQSQPVQTALQSPARAGVETPAPVPAAAAGPALKPAPVAAGNVATMSPQAMLAKTPVTQTAPMPRLTKQFRGLGDIFNNAMSGEDQGQGAKTGLRV